MSKFNSIVYRQGMAPEVAKAAVYIAMHPNAKAFSVGKTSVIPKDVLDKIPAGQILVLGTYYDKPSIEALSVKGLITVFFYGVDNISKYEPELVIVDHEMFNDREIEKYPWLRRTISRFEGRATPEDEAFQRGVIQQRTLEEIKSGDMFQVFARLVAGDYDEKTMISEGLATADVFKKVAISIDATAAMDVIVCGHPARFAETGPEPVMPVVEQLATHDSKLGLTMRRVYKDGKAVTMLTAFTTDPEHVDLGFVEEHWGGGGTQKCKGVTMDGVFAPTFIKKEGSIPELVITHVPSPEWTSV